MADKLFKSNQSVEKVFHIIEIMAGEPGPMRLQDIAIKAGMPASTALRLVNTLLSCGYVNQDSVSQHYSLSLKLAQIGDRVCSQVSIRDIAHPHLVTVSIKCQEASCLGVEQNGEVVYTDVVDGPDNMVQIMQRIGKRAPLHCTGIGKIFLLNYNQKERNELLAVKGMAALTPHTIVQNEEMETELDKIQQMGYAIDDEECELGVRCVAAPIRDYSSKVVAGISVSGPVSRLSKEKIPAIASVIVDAANRISQMLAYSKP